MLLTVARATTVENKLQPPATLVRVLGKLWKAQGHYSQPVLFPTSFRSSPVAASPPHCCEALLETSRNDASDCILCCPKWHALQLAKTFAAAQSFELQLAVTNAAGAWAWKLHHAAMALFSTILHRAAMQDTYMFGYTAVCG